MTQEASPGTSLSPVPPLRAVEPEPTTDPVRAGDPVRSVPPVMLDRLLSVAVLTPAQASLVAVTLIEAARPDGAGNGGSRAGTHLAGVTITPDGEVEVTRSATDAGTPVTELVEQLLHNARRLPAHPRPEQLVLLRRLEELVGDPLGDPEAAAHALERALVDALGPGARQLLTGQLAALVEAFAHVAPGVPVGVDGPSAAGPERALARARTAARRRADPARSAADRAPRRRRVLLRRRPRGRAALVVLVVAAVLAVSGYVVVSGSGSDILGSFGREDDSAAPDPTTPDQAAEQPAKKPAKKQDQDRPRAVRPLAPRQAGAITGVVVETTGTCRPGSLCPVTVTVRFRPASTSRTIGWRVGAARVCTPGIAWSGPVTVTAQPGWTTVYASSSVRVPKGRRLALTALTTTPARAQARPVPVANASLQC